MHKKREMLLAGLLAESREELARADNKASILLAAAGIIAGAIVSAVLAGDWAPVALPVPLLLGWWPACILFAYAIFALGSALFPAVLRAGHKPNYVSYFGDVVALADHGDVEEALGRTLKNSTNRDLDQLVQISRIVARKYKRIRWALQALAGSFSLLILIAISWCVIYRP